MGALNRTDTRHSKLFEQQSYARIIRMNATMR